MIKGLWKALRQPNDEPVQPLHYCNLCKIVFTRAYSLKAHNSRSREHAKNAGLVAPKGFWCQDCERVYSRKDSLDRHQQDLHCRGNFAGNAAEVMGHTYHMYSTSPCSHADEVEQQLVLPLESPFRMSPQDSGWSSGSTAPGTYEASISNMARSGDDHTGYTLEVSSQGAKYGAASDESMSYGASFQCSIMVDVDYHGCVDTDVTQYADPEDPDPSAQQPKLDNGEAMSTFSADSQVVRLSQTSLFGRGSIRSLQWSSTHSPRSRIASMITVGTRSTMSCEMPAPGGLPMDNELSDHRQRDNGNALRVKRRVFVKSLDRDILPRGAETEANRVDLVKKMLQVYSVEADSNLLLLSISYGAMLHILPGLPKASPCTRAEKEDFVMISGYLAETQQWLCRPVFESQRKYARPALPIQICKPVLDLMEYWRLYDHEVQDHLTRIGLF